ncbi:uncharacterized protein LOC127794453 isoform X2 [Diospyros lotus]|nr:uncharacterized protein LOC127794453 isoform X2 [Diospyros lotus]
MSVIFASILISRHEARLHSENGSRERQEEEPAAAGLVYEDEVWKPCLKVIHPAWLLAYRVVAFFVLLILLILNADVDGATIFYFYTQWTFTLITIYFGLGSLLSIYGCYHYQNKVGGDSIDGGDFEAGQDTFAATTNASDGAKHLEANQECCARQLAGFWGYAFQIIFQMNAGAVILTDCVFWFVIVPFLAIKDYSLNFLIISMHTVNAVFLLGDTYLNCMRFPWFRIAYFLLWTVFYVVFQWIVHACVSLWWPYPFLELSSSFAPLWYFSVGLMHIPCFAIFALVIKMKHSLLSKHFPHSYQCVRS